MTKLEHLNLKELSVKEMREISGGWGFLTFLVAAVVMLAIDYFSDGELDQNVN